MRRMARGHHRNLNNPDAAICLGHRVSRSLRPLAGLKWNFRSELPNRRWYLAGFHGFQVSEVKRKDIFQASIRHEVLVSQRAC